MGNKLPEPAQLDTENKIMDLRRQDFHLREATVKIQITQLSLDPTNARKHSQRNLDAIAASLKKFGQRKPIVVHKGVVLAGNGTLEAAKTLGWTEIEVAEVPSDWDLDTAKAYALADNRTAELAEWDESELAKQLLELQDADWDITELGFEITKVLDEPNFQPESIEQPRLDQRAPIICPQCSFEWRVGAKGEIDPV